MRSKISQHGMEPMGSSLDQERTEEMGESKASHHCWGVFLTGRRRGADIKYV
jgi:hypothetical protein